MNAEDQSAAPDASGQNEPETTGTEQATTESKSLGTDLLKIAAEMGHDIGETPPSKEEAKPEAEPELPLTEEAPETDAEPAETEEEEKPAAKKGAPWPDSAKARVAEETARKNRATERAEKAEALAAQLQTQLQQAVAPQPTEDDPFKDINDPGTLARLEKSYEKAVELSIKNPKGAADVLVGRNPDGTEVRRDFEEEEIAEMKWKAEQAIRKYIPERRTYLQQRAVADAEAARRYPELTDPDSEFCKASATLAYNVLTGRAAKEPDLLIWVARAVKQFQLELQEKNGNDAVKSPEAKKIVQAARQKVAPTPTRTRSFVERGSSSVNLDKSRERLKQEGSAEAAEELVAKLLSGGGSSKRVEPIGE